MPEDVPLNGDVGVPSHDDALEKLRARLYANEPPPRFVEPSLHAIPPVSVPAEPVQVSAPVIATAPVTAWEPPPTPKAKVKKHFSWTVLFLAVAVGFFLIAGGISTALFLLGTRTVSSSNIVISVQGPATISSGTTVPLTVTVRNNNPAAISNTDISLNFPDGTRSADDVTQPLLRYADSFGSIPAGGTVTRTVQAVFFGSVNQAINIPIAFQYNTANSNALFSKNQNYGFTITSSPLTLTAQSVGTVASGQPFTIALTIRSNATTPLNNIAVDAVYPSAFTIQKSEIGTTQTSAANLSNPLLTIGTLAPGQEKDITITGTLSGSNNDLQNFQFTVGTANADNAPGLSVAYASQSTSITLTPPFLAATLSLNHGSTDSTVPTIISGGDTVSALLSWTNSLATSLSNGQIQIKLSGKALDSSSVNATNGYYDSSNDTLLFSQQTEPSLGLLNSGDTGNGSFSFSTKTGAALNSLRNPTIQLQVSVAGQPAGGAVQTITNTLTDTIKVATDLELASRAVYSTGPFTNSGSLPPVPNQPTTYTIELAVTNTTNDVGGATATMILPPYVSFTGKQSASAGALTYDSATQTVTWTIGDVAAGTTPLTAAFQISFVPNDAQAQTEPVLIGNQTLTGTDRFTNTSVGNTAQALTTAITTDPAYRSADSTVGTAQN